MRTGRSFTPSQESVGAARRFVVGEISDIPADLRDSVSVMVSELTTNAFVHAAGGFEVTVERSDHQLLISVTDEGDGLPQLQSPDSFEPHGRGLRIVEALSDRWGVSSTARGKCVWFQISLDTSTTDPTAGGVARTEAGGVGDGDSPGVTGARPLASPGGAGSGTLASRLRRPRRRPRATPGTPIGPGSVAGA